METKIIITEEQITNAVKKALIDYKNTLNESEIINTINYEGHNLEFRNYDLSIPEDKQYIKDNKEIIWNILQKGYEKLGGFKGFQSKKDLLKKSPFLRLGFCDGEIVTVTVYNQYLGGNKCVGATCVKDERHSYAVKLLELILKYNIENWNQWVWIEASDKIEKICNKLNAFNVPVEYAIIYLNGIPYSEIDDYHYNRIISGKIETKTIFGFKDKETYEILKNDINNKIIDFIKKIESKNKDINENLSKKEIIYQRYLQQKGEIEKQKNIVNYFVYLKDDEKINEFPKESLNILKKTIHYIEEYIKTNNDENLNKILKMTISEGYRVLRTSTELVPLAV